MFALGYLGAAMWSGSHWSFGQWMLVCPLPLDMSGPKFLVQGLFWKVEWPSSWHPHDVVIFFAELGSGGRRNYYHGAKKDSCLDETLQMQLLSEEIWRDLQAPTLQVAIGNWGEEIFENLVCHLAAYAPVKFFDSFLPSASIWKNMASGSRLGGFGPRLGLTLRSRGSIFHGIHGISWQLVWRTKVFTIIASDANSEVECQVFSGEVEIAGEICIPQDGPGSGSRAESVLLRESIASHQQHEAVAIRLTRVVRQVICIHSCWLKLARCAEKRLSFWCRLARVVRSLPGKYEGVVHDTWESWCSFQGL